MGTLLEITGLSGGYQKGFDIVDNVSLTLDEGETLAVVGKNGCGKSTLAKAIVGLTSFRSGSLSFKGKDISQLPVERMQSLGISIMQQGGKVFPNLSVWENFQLAARHIGDEKVKQQILELIPLLSSTPRGKLHKSADKLSGGERHQLALAMTLASARELIILDEPSAGLMPTAVNALYDILAEVRKTFHTTILLIEQNVKQAEDFATRFVFMDNGKIVYYGNDTNIIEELMYK